MYIIKIVFSVLSCLQLQFEVKENMDIGKTVDPSITISSERSNVEKNFTAKNALHFHLSVCSCSQKYLGGWLHLFVCACICMWFYTPSSLCVCLCLRQVFLLA